MTAARSSVALPTTNDGLPGVTDGALARVDSLRKVFAGSERPALDDVSLEIKPGLVTGLVGPDGAGKTTLLRILAGLLLPTSGTARVLDRDPGQAIETLRGALGYMPQKFGLYEDLTVLENLELYAELKGLRGQARVDTFARLLTFTDLTRFTARLAGKLSGGMKQKLGLACTLLGTPKVLLLDEPGVGVDPVSRRELWQMVHQLISEGNAVVWSTAYLDEAEACDRVVLLNEGRVLFTGPPSDLHARVRGRVFLLKGGSESPRAMLRKARRDPSSLDGVVQGKSVRLIAREGVSLQPVRYGVSPDARLEPVAPRFEDGFVDLLGGVSGAESALAQAMVIHPHDGRIAIETRRLTKKFGDFVAADAIDLRVERGEVFGLLGPNGAGKSTTFKMLCGLLAPTSGEAEVAGVDMRRGRSEARQRLGYMAQKFSLYGHLTIAQNLDFFAGAYALSGRAKADAIARLVDVFDFAPYFHTKSAELPLGLKQRLALAAAVLHGPEILFLDEPTSGVDPLTRREFWLHINGIVERGVTVLVTTHFMDEAEYCDRIALIDQGKMIAVGTPDDLKARAATSELPEPTMEEAFIALVQGRP
jgi:ABC-2 type transport system ATP-binding protein